MGLRYYDPQTGRFTQQDPIQDGLNWYAYCGGNPVNYVDPHGEFFVPALIGAGVGAVVGGGVAYIRGEDVLAGAGRGALIGGIAGLTGGLAGGAVAGIAGGGIRGAIIAGGVGGAIGGAAGDAAWQGLSIRSGQQCAWNWGQTRNAAIFGGVLGGASGGVSAWWAGRASFSALERGQLAHKAFSAKMQSQGMVTDRAVFRLADSKAPLVRPDAVDFKNRVIYELKPNNPRKLTEGQRQLTEYKRLAESIFGGTWETKLIPY